jgi:hypothetical protein
MEEILSKPEAVDLCEAIVALSSPRVIGMVITWTRSEFERDEVI